MGKRTSYLPGTFSWVDLATTDTDASKAFYAGLFGWEIDDEDADGSDYSMCRLDGDDVCGLFTMPDEMRAAGIPPNWTNYVTVAEADAAVARAKELGATAMSEAFDVLDIGRMGVLSDPQGAVFAVWEPRGRIGAEQVNDIGCLCMNELATSDLAAAATFYEGLFGWTTENVDTGPDGPPIVAAANQGTLNASFSVVQEGVPAHWRPYFTVESVDAAMARVQELGGTIAFGPQPLPDGAFVLVLDPHGALCGLFEGPVDP